MRQFIRTIAVCSLPLLALSTRGEDITAANEPMMVTVEREPINTIEPIYRAYVSVETDKFTFIIPSGYRTAGDPAHGRLLLETEGGSSLITFNFLSSGSDGIRSLSSDACRALLLDRHAKGKVTAEYNKPIAGHTGMVFEMEWLGPSGLMEKTRAYYVTTNAGLLEITMTTGAKNFDKEQPNFTGFATSLTESVNGKLQVTRLGDSQ